MKQDVSPGNESLAIGGSMSGLARESTPAGLLIVNADDWGRDRDTTERTLECILEKTVSSVSAMVFMEDSERAAGIARARRIDAGLHLNFTTPFTASNVPKKVIDYQRKLSAYLRWHRLAQVVYHPGLTRCFEYVVSAQRDEYQRLYQTEPGRIDGHHHMHLCSNMLLGRLLPAGVIVRRNFSIQPGEKIWMNRQYRQAVDRALARRHPLTDYFFSLPPLYPPNRLQSIMSLAKESIVEVETHPINLEEYRFLREGEIFHLTAGAPVASSYMQADGWSPVK